MTSTAVERRAPSALVAEYRDDFASVLPAHLNPDAWVRVSQGALRRNPKLAAAAKANPASLLSALLDCARLGLEVGDTYHLVPFGNEVTGVRDYKGEVELAFRSGVVAKITANVVRAGDRFEFDEARDDRPTHVRAGADGTGAGFFASERGPIVGVYAFAVFTDGTTSHVVTIGREELDRHKAVSRNPGNWEKWPEPYTRKTAVHELRKFIPTSADYRRQLNESTAAAETVAVTMAERVGVPIEAVEVQDSSHDGDLDAVVVEAEIVDDDETPGDAAAAGGEPAEEAAPGPSIPGAASDQADGFVPMTTAQSRALHSVMRHVYGIEGDARHAFISERIGRTITSTAEVTKDEASMLLDALQDDTAEVES